jgi:hypothetical protein
MVLLTIKDPCAVKRITGSSRTSREPQPRARSGPSSVARRLTRVRYPPSGPSGGSFVLRFLLRITLHHSRQHWPSSTTQRPVLLNNVLHLHSPSVSLSTGLLPIGAHHERARLGRNIGHSLDLWKPPAHFRLTWSGSTSRQPTERCVSGRAARSDNAAKNHLRGECARGHAL